MTRTCRKNYSLAEENLITRAETLRVESIAVEVDGKLFLISNEGTRGCF